MKLKRALTLINKQFKFCLNVYILPLNYILPVNSCNPYSSCSWIITSGHNTIIVIKTATNICIDTCHTLCVPHGPCDTYEPTTGASNFIYHGSGKGVSVYSKF